MNSSTSKIKELLQKLKELILRGKDWAIKNRKVTIPIGAGVVVLLVVMIAVIANMGKSKVTEAGASAEESKVLSDGTVPEEPLEENAYPEVNNLVSEYFNALADGNMEQVDKYKNYTEDTARIRLEKKSQYIDSFENITCYTKKGMLENTYLAYVYSEVKFKDIETPAPALDTFYICPNESGALYIYDGEIDDNITNYIKEISTQDNVVELFNRVNVKYKEAIEQDEALSAFLNELPTKIKTEVGEALAEAEAGKNSENASVSENEVSTEAPTEEAATPETPAEQPAAAPVIETVQATDTVNVRSSDSETADKLGKVQSGTNLKRMEVKENGWSKIEFEGKEAYIKTEFLKIVDTQTADAAAETPEETPAETAPDKVAASPEGKVTVQETVNVRKSANESAERLGVAYQGDQFELIMKQADGWSKINYKGQNGYIKSDYVK